MFICIAENDGYDEHTTVQSLKDASPFSNFFNAAVADDDTCAEVQHDCPPNEYFCPGGFDAILSYMHLYPLWAAALHNDVHRFASGPVMTVSEVHVRPRSNAKVESYFA